MKKPPVDKFDASQKTGPKPEAVDMSGLPKIKRAPRQEKGEESKDTTVSRHRDTVTPRNHDTIEQLRKSVKDVGKEAATHRFTEKEKRAIAEIVFSYGQTGYRTSENELTRIAINWLVLDYKANGESSVLHRVIKALNS